MRTALTMIRYCSSQRWLCEDDIGAIIFFGHHRLPQGIPPRHKALTAALTGKTCGQTHEDVFLCIPPLYHTGAKMHWFGSLVSCSRAVLLKGTKPEWIMNAISQEKCTIVWLLVPWAQDLLDAIDRGDVNLDKLQTRQLRLMHIGAQPVPPSLVGRWCVPHPPVRHQLWPQRIHRAGLRTPGRGKRAQGGRHRKSGLRLGDPDRGRRGTGCGTRRRGRTDRPGPRRHVVLLQRQGRHR